MVLSATGAVRTGGQAVLVATENQLINPPANARTPTGVKSGGRKNRRGILKLPAGCGVLPGMNYKNILLAAALVGGLLSPIAAQAAGTGSVIAARGDGFRAPAPLHVVSPVNVPRRYQNETIRLSMTVDEAGRPRNVQLLAGSDPALAKHLLPAVARWQFKPASLNGRPVSTDVVLPLQLVDRPAS
jgi:TonB family protein